MFTFWIIYWDNQTFKNRHAQFARNIDSIKSSGIHVIPFDHSDLLNIEYEFENGDIIKMDYVFFATSSFTDISQKEFEEFHHSLTFNQSNPFLNGILKWKMSM